MRVARKSLEGAETLTIVVMATLGVTISSMVSGAQSAPYLLSVMLAGLLSTLKLVRTPSKRSVLPAFAAGVLLLIVWLMQGLSFQSGVFEFSIMSSLLNVVAILFIIAIAAALCTSSEHSLARAFFVAWFGHFAILIYGITSGGLTFAQIGVDRFSGAGFREVIWAEVALGTLALALLSQRNYAILLTLPFSGLLIAATQMRAVGVAAVIGLAIWLYYTAYLKRSKSNRHLILFILPIPLLLYLVFQADVIIETLWRVLLLDDQHRGIASGFSGRFDNVRIGWELFVQSPLIGVGSLQQDAAYAHNGYVKVLAQYGIFGLFWIVFVALGLWRAWAQRNYSLLTVIVMLALYYVGQPRHLSFQVFPLVGVLAVFQAVIRLNSKGYLK